MTRLEKALYVTGLAYILYDTYDKLVLTDEQAVKIGKIIANEFQVEDYDNFLKEDAERVMLNLTIQMDKLVKELLEEEKNDNSLPVSE
jgi:uncharacterized protein YjgD (DUF1641 family)